MTTWLEHVAWWRDCQACPLGRQRTNIVLARGEVPCNVLFCGEAPGASEDANAQPFIGPAGNLLQKIIERALPDGMTYALTNLVACFPAEAKARGDNEPEVAEIRACRPRLMEFIGIAKPRLIVCVGNLAADYIGHDAYGKVMGAEVIQIVHPAHILARLPLAQKQMAVNKSIVVIRSAVENMLQ